MDELSSPLTRSRRSGAWFVVAVFAVVVAGCAEPSPVGAPEAAETTEATTETGASTTVPDPSSTLSSMSTTVTTAPLDDELVPMPPKPVGEPEIELLPVEPQVIEVTIDPETARSNYGDQLGLYFSFERVSGYVSYTVTSGLEYRSADESKINVTEGRVDGTFFAYTRSGNVGEPFEVIISADPMSPSPDTWVRDGDSWVRGGVDYLGLFALGLIMPEVTHGTLLGTFDTLTFSDWEAIDGVWYARYDASPEFVAANLGYERRPERLVDSAGDVWISPQGFMHSFEISATDQDKEGFVESTWRLSDLGSTTVDIPGRTDVSESTTTPSDVPLEVSMLEELLATTYWDPRVVLDGQSFRWRGRNQIDLVDLDITDTFSSSGGITQELWGSVGAGGIARERSYVMDPETREGGEFVQFDGMSSKRFGSFSPDGVFSSDEDWFSIESEANSGAVTFGSLSSGFLAYGGNETPTLEIIGVEETDGVRVTHLRAVVSNGVALGSTIDATFDFWIAEGSPRARVVGLSYTTNWTKDNYSNGVLVGRQISERSFEVYDVGDNSILIESP